MARDELDKILDKALFEIEIISMSKAEAKILNKDELKYLLKLWKMK